MLPWVAALLVLLPVLYVLSSGPMQTVAFRNTGIIFVGSGEAVVYRREKGNWWPKIYAPVTWASKHSWGRSIKTYWAIFPIRTVIPD